MEIKIYVYFSMIVLALCSLPIFVQGIPLQKLSLVEVICSNGNNELDLSKKKLSDIKGISALEVTYNRQRMCISEIPRLHLNLSGNYIKVDQLLSEIGELNNLVGLNLSDNYIYAISEEGRFPQNLEKLNLSGTQLSQLPNFNGLSNLRSLDLSGNALTSLSATIDNLINLQVLDLSVNKLVSLPSEIGTLSRLITLDISLNQLANLPAELCNLTELKEINLMGNLLCSLPENIDNLCHLEILNVSSNELIELPTSIGKLVHLARLNIDRNKLIDLPQEMIHLVNLEFLNMLNNNILDEVSALRTLSVLPSLAILEGSLLFEDKIRELRQSVGSSFLKLHGFDFKNNLTCHPYFERPMAEWTPQMAPVISKLINGTYYNYLDLSYKKLISLQGISDLQVYDLTEAKEFKRLKSISEIQNLYINLEGNNFSELPIDIQKLSITGINLSDNKNLQHVSALYQLPLIELKLNSCNNVEKKQILALLEGSLNHLMYFDIGGLYIPFEKTQLQTLMNILDDSLHLTHVTIPRVSLSTLVGKKQNGKISFIPIRKAIALLSENNIKRNKGLKDII